MSLVIADLVPHQAAMCLLDSIEHWDERTIVCRATSHRRLDHPLNVGERLYALCAIEYAAQAIAAHTSLLAGPQPQQNCPGFLASVRDVVTSLLVLNDLDDPLTVRAELILAQVNGHIYDVAVTAGQHNILTGRIMVMAGGAATPAGTPSTKLGVRP